MKTILFAILLSLRILAGEHIKPSKEDLEVGKWMTYAYQTIDINDSKHINYMLKSEAFTQRQGNFLPLAIFISKRFIKNEDILDEINLIDLNDNGLFMLLVALKQTNTKKSKVLYQKLLNKNTNPSLLNYMQSVSILDLSTLKITTPTTLDMLWASFMATGNDIYVENIIKVLQIEEENASVQDLLLLSSAQWSLTSNAKQHPKVLKICKRYTTSLHKTLKKHILEIIKKAQE